MRVSLAEPFAREFFAGRTEFELEARNLFGLVRALEALGPGFSSAAETRAAVAVDGTLRVDWSLPLEGAVEVLFIPLVAGG